MGIINFFKRKKQPKFKIANQNIELPKTEVEDAKIIDILNQEILDFFPKNGSWSSRCFNQPSKINPEYLPCHLRDNGWMSNLLHQNLIEKGIYISVPKIKAFIDSSKKFTDLRHNYELEIVRWQIEFMKNGGENWVMPKGFDEISLLCSPNVDKMFRGGVFETLSAIGMNKEVIEEGIEKNADIWREQYMNLAFRHAFEPFGFMRDQIEPADESHKNLWLTLRRYNYYIDHKDSVDKYGVVTFDMQCMQSDHEYRSQLIKTVDKLNKERKQVVDHWEKNPIYEPLSNNEHQSENNTAQHEK